MKSENCNDPTNTKLSCPECGLVFVRVAVPWATRTDTGESVKPFNESTGAFDCPRCRAHFTSGDFWAEHHFKMGWRDDPNPD